MLRCVVSDDKIRGKKTTRGHFPAWPRATRRAISSVVLVLTYLAYAHSLGEEANANQLCLSLSLSAPTHLLERITITIVSTW